VSAIDEMLCFSLYAASRATTQAYRPLLEPFGLTYPQYLVLVLLWECDGRAVSDLGQNLELDSGTLSPLLRRMTDAGILIRARSADDERVVVVSLTERGRALRADLAHVPGCIAAGARLTRERADELIDTLHRFTADMHASADATPAADFTSGSPRAAAATATEREHA